MKVFVLICTSAIYMYVYTGVEVGFEETVYTVVEGSGPATVTVAVLSGQLSSDVVVRLDTSQRSAEGIGAC